jgi:hypothetical protein
MKSSMDEGLSHEILLGEFGAIASMSVQAKINVS